MGILLPHVVRFNTIAVSGLYADLVHDIGMLNGDAGAAGKVLANRITDLLHVANLPTHLSDCGVSPGILPVLATEAADQWTGRFNPIPVGEPELQQLYEAAL